MRAALDKLDPGSRALLDLSVKRGIADDEIAQVLRTEPAEVAERRESILARIADDLGSNGPDLVSRVRNGLRDLPPEGLTASAEGNGYPPEDEPAEEVDGEVVAEEPAEEVVAEEPAAPRVEDAGPVVDGEVLEELPADEEEPSAEVAEPPLEEPPVEDPPVDADPIEKEPVTESSEPRGRAFPRTAALAALAAVAAIVLIVVLVSGGDESSNGGPGGSEPAQQQQPANGTRLESISGKGAATASIEGRGRAARLTLTATALGAAGHEAWLYDSLSDAVSIGRLKGGRLAARLPADPAKYRYLDVSVEPRDGNPNHSGQSVLRVPLSRLTRGG